MSTKTLYCVMSSSTQPPKDQEDCLVKGGIYQELQHAELRAKREHASHKRVWIEEYDVSDGKGYIDTINKDKMRKIL